MDKNNQVRSLSSVLGQVREILDDVPAGDRQALADQWLALYREMLPHGYAKPELLPLALHGMHQIAFERGINDLTATEWIDDPTFGVHDFDGGIGLWSVQYHRGNEVEVKIWSDSDAGPFFYKLTVRSSYDEVLFTSNSGNTGYKTVRDAFGIASAEAEASIAGAAH